MSLSLKNVAVRYGRVEAVRNVSLEVAESGFVAVIGANGAGKSTILKAISGLRPIAAGEIWFQGQRIDGKSAPEIAAAGLRYVPEGRRLFADMSVLENLEMGAYLRKDRAEVQQDLERVYSHLPVLKDRQKQRAGSLSGGEQQLLAVGRLLMSKPRMILLDEPTWGLSPLMSQEIARIVTEINRGGVGVLLVEQNALLALTLAQKGYVLETGTVVLADRAESLLNDHAVKKSYLGM